MAVTGTGFYPGAVYICKSGTELPPDYMYGVKTTTVTLQLNGDGWHLIGVETATLFPCRAPVRELRIR